MKNVRLGFFRLAEIQAIKAWICERLVIVAIFETRQSRDGVNANAEQVMRISLEKRQRLRIEFANLGEIVGSN